MCRTARFWKRSKAHDCAKFVLLRSPRSVTPPRVGASPGIERDRRIWPDEDFVLDRTHPCDAVLHRLLVAREPARDGSRSAQLPSLLLTDEYPAPTLALGSVGRDDGWSIVRPPALNSCAVARPTKPRLMATAVAICINLIWDTAHKRWRCRLARRGGPRRIHRSPIPGLPAGMSGTVRPIASGFSARSRLTSAAGT